MGFLRRLGIWLRSAAIGLGRVEFFFRHARRFVGKPCHRTDWLAAGSFEAGRMGFLRRLGIWLRSAAIGLGRVEFFFRHARRFVGKPCHRTKWLAPGSCESVCLNGEC